MTEHIAYVGQLAGLCGNDGTNWQMLGLLWSYYNDYGERKVNASAVAGVNYLTGTTVPTGEVWVIYGMRAWNAISASAGIHVQVVKAAVEFFIHTARTVAANVVIEWDGQMVLKAGDCCRAMFEGCTLNDDIFAVFWGYKMKVA